MGHAHVARTGQWPTHLSGRCPGYPGRDPARLTALCSAAPRAAGRLVAVPGVVEYRGVDGRAERHAVAVRVTQWMGDRVPRHSAGFRTSQKFFRPPTRRISLELLDLSRLDFEATNNSLETLLDEPGVGRVTIYPVFSKPFCRMLAHRAQSAAQFDRQRSETEKAARSGSRIPCAAAVAVSRCRATAVEESPRVSPNLQRMLDGEPKSLKIRPYLAARACTLAPGSVDDPELPAKIRERFLESLTEQGPSLSVESLKDAAPLFERSLKADLETRAAVELAVASSYIPQAGGQEKARPLADKASAWPDGIGDELPANADGLWACIITIGWKPMCAPRSPGAH